MSSGRSLINMRNNMPRGTPGSISVKADSSLQRFVVCVQTRSTESSWWVGRWLHSVWCCLWVADEELCQMLCWSPLWLRQSATPSPWLPAALVETGEAGSPITACFWSCVVGRRGCYFFQMVHDVADQDVFKYITVDACQADRFVIRSLEFLPLLSWRLEWCLHPSKRLVRFPFQATCGRWLLVPVPAVLLFLLVHVPVTHLVHMMVLYPGC